MDGKLTSEPFGPRARKGFSHIGRGLRPFRGLLVLLMAWLFVSATVITLFCRSFRISELLVISHLPLVIGLFAASSGPSAL